jgi:hypothetical protein
MDQQEKIEKIKKTVLGVIEEVSLHVGEMKKRLLSVNSLITMKKSDTFVILIALSEIHKVFILTLFILFNRMIGTCLGSKSLSTS